MTSRTWVGGDNNAAHPQDWSPTGAPKQGDTLFVQGSYAYYSQHGYSYIPYTVNVTGNGLQGTTVVTAWTNTTFNLTNATLTSNSTSPSYNGWAGGITEQGPGLETMNMLNSSLNLLVDHAWGGAAQVNMTGIDHLNVSTTAHVGINVASLATWIGGFDAGNESGILNLDITAGSGAVFHNTKSSASWAAATVVPLPVIGIGTFLVSEGAKLEFQRSVAAGQIITVSDVNYQVQHGSILQIDKPATFAASTVLVYEGNPLPPEIDIMALPNADSYTYANGTLSIFSRASVIDSLRLTDQTQYGFDVVKTSAGVDVVARTSPGESIVGALPVHQPPLTVAQAQMLPSSTTTIDADILGIGTLNVNDMTFGGFIGPGVTIDINPMAARLTIEHPTEFEGIVGLSAFPPMYVGPTGDEIELVGLQADGFSYANNVMTLTDQGKPVDTLRLSNSLAPSHDYSTSFSSVAEISGSVYVLYGQYAGAALAGAILPQHT